MKLEATVRYLLKLNQIKVTFYIICFIVFFSIDSISQKYNLTFNQNTALSDALLQSSKTFGFKVAFDAQRVGAVSVNKIVKGNSIDEFVASLLQNSGFTYLYKHGSYLIIESNEVKETPINECQLMGSVIDSETGEQLPFASVVIASQNILVSTSTNGTFSVKNLVSNPIRVNISYIGYFSIDTAIKWTNPNITQIFKLKHKINIIDSVSIKGNKIEMVGYNNDLDFSTTINPSKLIDLPVMAETDIFKTLQLLPGISYSENSAELSIRGGTSDQNLVLFDAQTLYSISHYYGVFSSINPNVVKDIQVFKGGFDSRYGERISGIVDITGKSGNQMKPSLIADFNLLSANISLEVPITKKLTILAAGRHSYSEIYQTSLAKGQFEKSIPVLHDEPNQIVSVSEPEYYFYDFNTKINYRVSENQNVSVSLYGGKDFFENAYQVKSQSIYVSNVDSNNIFNYGASANWQKQWNNSFFSALSVGTSGYINKSSNLTNISSMMNGMQQQKFLPDSQNIFETQNKNELKDYFISLQNTINLNNFNQLNFGLLFRYNTIFYHKDADEIYVYDNTNQSASLSSVYLQDKVSVNKNLSIKPGIRLSYYEGTHQFYFEPRFSAKYDFTPNFSCRFATGRYNQFISQVISTQETSYNKNFWIMANDSVNPVIKANHLIFGLSYKLKNILFDAEAYYKQYTGIQEYIFLSQFNRNTEFGDYFPHAHNSGQQSTNYIPPTTPSYFINGSGETYGIDFFVRYKARFFTSWLSYTLSSGTQMFDEINSGERIPALTDQRHQLSFSNLFTVGQWNFGAISLFSTGRPYISASVNERISPIIRNYSRMPNFYRFDLSANYNFNIKAAKIKTGISLINLFNTQNYFDSNSRTYDFDNATFNETNLIQSQQLSFNLFLQISL